MARRELGSADDKFAVLQLGRIVPRKGSDNVIRAVAAVHHRVAGALHAGKRVCLLVVGGQSKQPDELVTPEIGELRRLAQSLGIADRVTIVGQRQSDALRKFYVASNVFVSTPRYEPFGITPLEAMACARPVVVWSAVCSVVCSAVSSAVGIAVGGIKFSVVDGVSGFHVAPRDPQALAQRLEELRDNPAPADAMGRAGARRVQERFTWEQVSQSLVEVCGAARAGLAGMPTRMPMHAPARHIEAGGLLTPRKFAPHHVGRPVRTRTVVFEISAS